MLKAHQANIDLEQDVLRIKGRQVRFLPEHELPDNARPEHNPQIEDPSTLQPQQRQETLSRFPGSGNTLSGTGSALGSSPTPMGIGGLRNPSSAPSPAPAPPRGSGGGAGTPFSEGDIRTIMEMGASREDAIRTLRAAGGNLDVAASLLFS